MIPLAAFEEIIDASGAAPRIEALLPIGVRARHPQPRTAGLTPAAPAPSAASPPPRTLPATTSAAAGAASWAWHP